MRIVLSCDISGEKCGPLYNREEADFLTDEGVPQGYTGLIFSLFALRG